MKKEKRFTPNMLGKIHFIVISEILETAPNICLDFLAFGDTPKRLGQAWKTLQVWLDRSIKARLPFAEPLRRDYFDLPPKTFEAIAGCSQERQMIQDFHEGAVQFVRENSSDSKVLSDYLRLLRATLEFDRVQLTVPPTRYTGDMRCRMFIGIVAWQIAMTVRQGRVPLKCRDASCRKWVIPLGFGKAQKYCSHACRQRTFRRERASRRQA